MCSYRLWHKILQARLALKFLFRSVTKKWAPVAWGLIKSTISTSWAGFHGAPIVKCCMILVNRWLLLLDNKHIAFFLIVDWLDSKRQKSATATKIRLSFQSHIGPSPQPLDTGNYGMTDYGQTIWVDVHVRGKYYKWGKFCTKTMKIIQINGLFSRLICIHNIIGLVYYDVFNKK